MNILTFDIEDWWAYEYYSIGNKNDYLPRLNGYLNDILDILDQNDIKATFFCLGVIARQYPEIVKMIYNRGHHIGCHSDSHSFLNEKSPDFFYNDTRIAIDSLEQVTGEKINAYRAPAFSFTEKNKWVFEILFELGMEYDCSIFPAKRDFGGGFPSIGENEPFLINYNNARIKEFPMSIFFFMGKSMAYSGGGYFRLLPYMLIRKIMHKNDYAITYFHIRDFDFYQKRIFQDFDLRQKRISLKRYFQSYIGIKNAYKKFLRLLDEHKFVDINQAAEKINWDQVKIVNL
jgi:polysaccharide deacetylase family protein (PEP-CTERM system associated)